MSAADVAAAVRSAQAVRLGEVGAAWLDEHGYDAADADAVNEALLAAEYEAELAAPPLSAEDRAALEQQEAEAAAEHERRLPTPFARQPVAAGATFWALTYADGTPPRWYADEDDAEAALAIELEAGQDVRLIRFVSEADTRRRCQYNGCSALLPHTGKSGRPRSFCARHKKSAEADRKRRMRAQRQMDREQNWPTSIGRDS